ncbi:MAG: sulfite exporter TauE/SafE family protein, partial [Deltaproteobacteria bacterium]|nr:sulfite exporter TauE/SafE family protein [Deltaproteobacteria bacterium]
KVVIGFLIILFALLDLFPKMFPLNFGNKALSLGGVLSGFFGGLSGHQGAFRSTILLKFSLPKEVFVATSITLAFFVDAGRITIYGINTIPLLIEGNHLYVILAGMGAAILGSIIGNQILKKITMGFINGVVAILLFIIAILLILGII